MLANGEVEVRVRRVRVRSDYPIALAPSGFDESAVADVEVGRSPASTERIDLLERLAKRERPALDAVLVAVAVVSPVDSLAAGREESQPEPARLDLFLVRWIGIVHPDAT